MKAIILAAGMGSRLRYICKNKPKPLFEIKGKSLLEYSLDALSKSGIKDITIVIGYKGKLIKEKIGNEYEGVKIEYVENKLYESTGSMHSLYSAFEEKELEDCLVLDADIIYNLKAIFNFINNENKNAAFLTNYSGGADETSTVLDDSGKIIYLKLKKNEDTKFLKEKKVFEFNGISKFSKEFLSEMFDLYKKKIENNQIDENYEECAFEINKKIPWNGLVNEGFVLAEIDEKKDIERAIILVSEMGIIF